MYWDDKYNTETVSGEVLARMKQLMVDNNSTSSHSFLLDDDSTLPFAAQEVGGAPVAAESSSARLRLTWAHACHTVPAHAQNLAL